MQAIQLPKQVEQRAYPAGVVHNFYLYGEIDSDISAYVDMITTLDLSEEADQVNIYLNTPGGSLETSISIIHAMMRSKGNVVAHADGQVASAGTLLFFAADSFVVYPYASAMLHDGATIIGGKFNENLKSAQATSDLVRKICFDLYVPYFSEDEVDKILSGGDYYCDSDELHDRVVAGVEIKQQEIEEAVEKAEKGVDDSEEITIDMDVVVNNKKLKTHGQYGFVVGMSDKGIAHVELESGNMIKTKKSNLQPA